MVDVPQRSLILSMAWETRCNFSTSSNSGRETWLARTKPVTQPSTGQGLGAHKLTALTLAHERWLDQAGLLLVSNPDGFGGAKLAIYLHPVGHCPLLLKGSLTTLPGARNSGYDRELIFPHWIDSRRTNPILAECHT